MAPATLAGLALADLIECPLALVVAAGHILASSRSGAAHAAGRGTEEAAA